MENNEPNQYPQRERGGCITAFLILMFIANPLLTIFYVVAGDTVRQAMPSMPDWAIPVLAVFGLINLGLAIAVWNWKKFGIYGFWASAIIILFINLSIGISPVRSLFGMLGPIIITLLVRPKWDDFE